jgi:uncharacterized membrane protein
MNMVVGLTGWKIALTVCMAALYVALSYLPGFPVVGVPGAEIELVSGVVPIFGFILGPWFGALASLLGAFVSRVLIGAILFGWLTLPTTPLSAFVAGSLVKPRFRKIKGWQVSALILAVLISFWYLSWVGRAMPYFVFLHWTALIVVLFFRHRFVEYFTGESRKNLNVCVTLGSFVSVMTAHLCGTLIFILSVELVILRVSNLAFLFFSLIPIVTVERLILTIFASAVGVPVISAIRSRFSHLLESL